MQRYRLLTFNISDPASERTSDFVICLGALFEKQALEYALHPANSPHQFLLTFQSIIAMREHICVHQ